jgi:IclR family acetate operon transcriptional repressor
MPSEMEGGATARRALRLLEALASTGPVRPLEELAAATGLTKSTAYRLLRVLQDEQYVERAEGGGYRLGSRMVGLAAAALPHLDVYAAMRPVLARLARLSGETATLHRRSGDVAVLVMAAENEQASLRRVAAIGEMARLYRGCSGQAILAAAADRDAVLTRAVPSAERAPLRQQLDEISSRGYALSDGANHPGVAGIATWISATAGSPAALSVAVSGPAERWTHERRLAFAGELRRAEAGLSELVTLAGAGSEPAGRPAS